MNKAPATSSDSPARPTRRARFAGSWYPRDPQVLRDLIQSAWDQAGSDTFPAGWPGRVAGDKPETDRPAPGTTGVPETAGPRGKPGVSGSPGITDSPESPRPEPGNTGPRGILLPHPGLAFGLATQARGIKRGLGAWQPARIIILSPSHYSALPPDRLFSAAYGALETPLGRLTHHLPEKLPLGLTLRQDVLDTEHGLECLLPLLSWCWPQAQYTLIACGGASSGEGLARMARTVRSLVDPLSAASTLLVASSDMSHCGWRFDDPARRPVDMETAEFAGQILQRDRTALETAGTGTDSLLQQRQSLAPTMCGLIPVLLVQSLLGGVPFIVDQSTSLNIRQDNEDAPEDDTFVTYAAAVWKGSKWKN